MSTAPRADQLSATPPKSSQSDRLIAAMTELCAGVGYREATIAEVIAAAGVSRATFYDYFTDKRDCLLAAQAIHLERLHTQMGHAVARAAEHQATRAALGALLEFASDNPAAMQLLTRESLAAGGTAATRYDAMFATIGSTLARGAPVGAYVLAPEILLAGICRAIWPRLHAGETAVAGLLEQLDSWIASYRLPDPQQGAPCQRLTNPPSSPFLPDPPLRAPKPLPPGRRVLPQGEVNRNRRERILYATAEVSASSGYLAITVDDIVARAQIARATMSSTVIAR